jgi:ribosomal protein S12 methylthiotransferase accessory factor
MADGAPCAVSAERVLRRPGPPPPFRLSTGCAAGTTRDAARLNALLEAVERDAAALWWRARRPARALDLGVPALAEAAARIAAWREGAEAPRRTWALHLEAAADVPVVAVVTADPEGRDLSIGVAARPSLAAALVAAAREAVQGELSLDLIAERRAVHGDGVLGPADRDRLALAALDPARTPRLWPRLPPAGAFQPEEEIRAARVAEFARTSAPDADSATICNALVENLGAAQHSCFDVDLTRSRFGLPVAFATAPGLQPFPAAHVSPRLEEAMRAASAAGDPAAPGSEPEAPLF